MENAKFMIGIDDLGFMHNFGNCKIDWFDNWKSGGSHYTEKASPPGATVGHPPTHVVTPTVLVVLVIADNKNQIIDWVVNEILY